MRNDLLFAAALALAAAVACLCLAPPAAGPDHTPATAAANTPAEAPAAFEAPLSDLVATMPPEQRRPKADATVRVVLPPAAADQPEVLYCSPPLVGGSGRSATD